MHETVTETKQNTCHDVLTNVSDTFYTVSESPKLAVVAMLLPAIHIRTGAGQLGFLSQVSPTSPLAG
ncbi:hypothetical protein N7519_010833 [Penicillium mononematosum]|uniref:uncharacterized protein n=1 Tax=Penicillium mononematosum TaxID=268346 RepID=UPI002546B889|nr:uncharacterized protein N7519_010833 [Penicillium mononematosum]KAJ6180372.1 hypothetical protein N7519_010833 [Penicillium mononematosum]